MRLLGDLAQWSEVGYQVNQGRALYVEVFDNKDVGFFALVRILDSGFGLYALALMWASCWLLILWCLLKLATNASRQRTNSVFIPVMAFVIILMTTAFGIYDGMTNLLPSSILLCSFTLFRIRRFESLAVYLTLIAPLLKITFLPVSLIILTWYLYMSRSSLRQFQFRKLILALSAFALTTLYLFLTYSFGQWVEAIRFNFDYAATSASSISGKDSHFELILENLTQSATLVTSIIIWLTSLVLLFFVGLKQLTSSAAFLAALNLTSVVIFTSTYLWPHHALILLLPSLLNLEFSLNSDSRLDRLSSVRTKYLGAFVIIVALLLPLFGLNLKTINPSLEVAKNVTTLFKPYRKLPSEWVKEFKFGPSYAYVNRSEIGPFPARFFDVKAKLNCPDTFLFRVFEKRAQSQLDCALTSELIFIDFEVNTQILSASIGDRSLFDIELREFGAKLGENYSQVPGNWEGWLLFKVNDAVNS